MAMTEQWRFNFDSPEKVAQWYYTPMSSSGGIVPNVRFTATTTDSFAEIVIGRTSAAERVGAGGAIQKAAFLSKSAMDADLAWPAGAIGFCFDANPVLHGKYIKIGASGTGNWGARQGSIDDRCWNDPNHSRTAWLELLMQSWCKPGDPGAVTGKIAWPSITDLRGAEIRWEMRAKNLILGPNAKIVQHMQTHVPSQQLWPTDTGTNAQRSFVNALQIANPISDQLMLGDGGYDAPNPVRGVHDSGWRTVRVPLNPDPAEWQQLGAIEGREGIDPPLRYYNYVVSPPSEFLANFTGNAYMVVAHKVTDAASKANPPSDLDKIAGTLQFKSVSIWK